MTGEHICPLTLCPREFSTKSEAHTHCKSVHGVTPESLREFNETYQEPDGRTRIWPTSIGNSVDFTYTSCEVCGESKSIRRERAEKHEWSFCSRECQFEHYSNVFSGDGNPNWKDTSRQDYYGPNWEEKRERRIALDDHQCVVCGLSRRKHREMYSQDLHVHHVVPIRDFRQENRLNWEESNQMSNLVALCSSCHGEYEDEPPEFFESVTQSA